MRIKKPTTFDEQLQLLKTRGLVVENEEKCLAFLRSVNYYRFTAYLLPFKQNDNCYYPGTTFDRVYRVYEFDRRLRSLLFSIVEEIEIYLRAQLSYYFAHTYGTLFYLDPECYSEIHDHEKFLLAIDAAIVKNKNTPVAKHYEEVYYGAFPIWAIVDFLSIGNLYYFYADWMAEDKKYIAKELFNTTYPFLDSWMKCLTVLRNRCAHYSRLYYSFFTDKPKIPPGVDHQCSGRVFDQLLMLKYLYPYKAGWNTALLLPLETLVLEYRDSIDYIHIGFPDDWKSLLEHEK